MWVWSDELVERVSRDDVDVRKGVPLIAYAVGSEADLDDLAAEILGGTVADTAEARQASWGDVNR
jgi:hypothetical protein